MTGSSFTRTTPVQIWLIDILFIAMRIGRHFDTATFRFFLIDMLKFITNTLFTLWGGTIWLRFGFTIARKICRNLCHITVLALICSLYLFADEECPPGQFNKALPGNEPLCTDCFCFGVTNECEPIHVKVNEVSAKICTTLIIFIALQSNRMI